MQKIISFLFTLCLAQSVRCQTKYNKTVFENYVISANVGSSMVLTEYIRDLSGTVNEMNHSPNFTTSLKISKLLTQSWEIGYECEYSTFQGYQNTPDFSAYHYGHAVISKMRIEPVNYTSTVLSHSLVVCYRFNQNKAKRIIPYVLLRYGFTNLYSRLSYKSNNELIFAKIGSDASKPGTSSIISSPNFGFGFGNEIILTSNLSINVQADITNISDDNLDGVHNFRAQPPEGYSNYVSALYSRFTIGASYYVNPDRKQKRLRKYQLKDSFKNKRRKKKGFPWVKK